ncbi:hypothetical protein GCM10029992_08980 [Glycomyces albus]
MNATPSHHNEFHEPVHNFVNAEHVSVYGYSYPKPQEHCYWNKRALPASTSPDPGRPSPGLRFPVQPFHDVDDQVDQLVGIVDDG